ncbi:Allophanate hydrolase 2 subunit 2 [Devosia sp. LC5]|uniref:5-oxoprolinase subunit C family protein n=1 Tax=Devosia sp. LC5 TaxID=1502724 RepID=UPI0004E405E0|nr:biotin-dependent carboxyltransferase family protein [Devosia sp. LC5]KFC72293.1 Allophanate hydrolase 2 subunit 2 [Devosia sp. LC5]
MSAVLTISRAAPLSTIQDAGRFGMLRHGISASGAMDAGAFRLAGALAGVQSDGAIEFTAAGLDIEMSKGRCVAGMAGGGFKAAHNGTSLAWPGRVELKAGDRLSITPGDWGNYGYLRFDRNFDLPVVMGGLSTSTRAMIGGLEGRALKAGDVLALAGVGSPLKDSVIEPRQYDGPIRVIWGLHADMFTQSLRQRFLHATFAIARQMDRMGVRLSDPSGVFAAAKILSLVSDAVVPGDIQIMGDGTPVVLMRDHQPTGGYPRIATIASVDLDRFAQLRPGAPVAFQSINVDHAHLLLRSGQP